MLAHFGELIGVVISSSHAPPWTGVLFCYRKSCCKKSAARNHPQTGATANNIHCNVCVCVNGSVARLFCCLLALENCRLPLLETCPLVGWLRLVRVTNLNPIWLAVFCLPCTNGAHSCSPSNCIVSHKPWQSMTGCQMCWQSLGAFVMQTSALCCLMTQFFSTVFHVEMRLASLKVHLAEGLSLACSNCVAARN